jgi:hypothetical protein
VNASGADSLQLSSLIIAAGNPARRVALIPGCHWIGYKDHTGCHQSGVLTAQKNVVKSANP